VEGFLRRWETDFVRPPVYSRSLLARTEGDAHRAGRFRDEWGCVFENVLDGVIGEVKALVNRTLIVWLTVLGLLTIGGFVA